MRVCGDAFVYMVEQSSERLLVTSPAAFVEIPAEPTLLRTAGPPLRVPLPLEARPRADFPAFLLMAAAFAGGLALLLFAWLLVASAIAVAPLALVAFGPAGAALGFLGGVFIAGACVYFLDLARQAPALRLTRTTFWDRRQMSAPLSWADVTHAELRRSWLGAHAVLLTLRAPAKVRRNPLRFGALPYLARRRSEELVVPLSFVREGRVVARSMVALAGSAPR
jgi:hypothetical protein